MKELKNRIDILVESSNGDKNIIETIKKDRSVAPFSTENRLLAYFLSIGELSFDDYSLLCQEYYDRSQDVYKRQLLRLLRLGPG